MSNDHGAQIALYAVMIILPLSALIARRPAGGQVLKMAVAWVAIFAVGLLAVSQRDRFSGLFSDQRVAGGETRIQMAEDGHFWADVTVDGVARRMLIDSGATVTALSQSTARAAGLDLDESPFASGIETANGRIVARNATVKTFRLGNITARELGVVVSPAFGDTDVVGMNFLSRLQQWRVEGKTLILTPRTA